MYLNFHYFHYFLMYQQSLMTLKNLNFPKNH
jgi:hypothetical protein